MSSNPLKTIMSSKKHADDRGDHTDECVDRIFAICEPVDFHQLAIYRLSCRNSCRAQGVPLGPVDPPVELLCRRCRGKPTTAGVWVGRKKRDSTRGIRGGGARARAEPSGQGHKGEGTSACWLASKPRSCGVAYAGPADYPGPQPSDRTRRNPLAPLICRFVIPMRCRRLPGRSRGKEGGSAGRLAAWGGAVQERVEQRWSDEFTYVRHLPTPPSYFAAISIFVTRKSETLFD